jgi:hypothetical protein
MATPSPHVALLGDSIFDNGAYTRGAPDVVAHLRGLLPAPWRATLCARDGAVTAELPRQLEAVPSDATHLVIAIGGNDALRSTDLLALRVQSSDEVLRAFAERVGSFEHAYRQAIARAMGLGRPLTIATVYNGALERDYATVARVGLTLFNDVIVRTAIDLRLTAIELRSICTEPADYANPIEPSDQGGRKIALAIARAVGAVGSAAPARIWGTD